MKKILLGIVNVLLLLIMFILWYYKGFFELDNQVYFYDLPKGEATLMIYKNYQKIILIDSGDNNEVLVNILKNKGIKKIDYLIISHSDSDHIAGAILMTKYIKIDNLIVSIYENNQKIEYLKKYSNHIYYVKGKDKIENDYFMIDIIEPSKDYQNINDNSLVFNMKIFNHTFCFTGDISTKVEEKMMNNRVNIDVDFYKVPHHGSITSSSINYLKMINYRYAVIMSGYYNTFSFPNMQVVSRYHDVLLTKDKGTIKIIFRKNKFKLFFTKNE